MVNKDFPRLNLPPYSPKLTSSGQRTQIFDSIRKKYVTLTPEEWVRQHFINFLVTEKKFPVSLMAIETGIKYNRLQKRGDLVVYNNLGHPFLILECKAPGIKISQDTFDQAARYNFTLKVKYIVVTNGLNHFCCEMDYEKETYTFLKEIPDYKSTNPDS